MSYQRFERDGRFGIVIEPDCVDFYGDADLGASPCFTLYSFLSEEAREYFIQAYEAREALRRAAAHERWAREEIAELQTLRGAWRNLKQAMWRRK